MQYQNLDNHTETLLLVIWRYCLKAENLSLVNIYRSASVIEALATSAV